MNTLRKLTIILTLGMALASCSTDKGTGIVAHRGFWNCDEAGFAKNSIAALHCAQEAGFWGSEFDVNMTSDEVLLVYHDGEIEGKKIEEYPYSTFQDFRLKNGEAIPTIDQYLEQGKKCPETMLVYELKPHSCDTVEDRFVELTLAKLEEYGLLNPERVMFISFSFHMCEVLAAKLPEFTVQYLGCDKAPAEVKAAGINGIDYHYNDLNKNATWTQDAHDLGMSVNVWTVNERFDMESMFNQGVDQLTTDNPLDAREQMKKMNVKEIR